MEKKMKPESIIKKIVAKTELNKEMMAIVRGRKKIPKPDYYVNIETGDEYRTIVGGIGWPGKIEDRDAHPGFAVIAVVEKSEAPDPNFRVLEEVEEKRVEDLIWRCVELRYKYGYSECPELLHVWYGDHERYLTPLDHIGREIRRKYEDKGFYITPPADFEQPNAIELYAETIFQCMRPDNKRLHLGDCKRLRSALQNFAKDSKDSPAIWVLGGVVHTLFAYEPWKMSVGQGSKKSNEGEEGNIWGPIPGGNPWSYTW